MRVLFAAQLLAALAYAGGAPAPSGNTAKRHKNPELAPHRYDKRKTLIAKDQEESNLGGGQLDLQVILKADDKNRLQQELWTTLFLDVEGLEPGMTVNMGWAMKLSTEEELPDLGEFEKLDE